MGQQWVQFNYAQLQGAMLIQTKMLHANLFEANLNYASLNYSDLSDSNIKKTKLNNADLNDAICINIQFDSDTCWTECSTKRTLFMIAEKNPNPHIPNLWIIDREKTHAMHQALEAAGVKIDDSVIPTDKDTFNPQTREWS